MKEGKGIDLGKNIKIDLSQPGRRGYTTPKPEEKPKTPEFVLTLIVLVVLVSGVLSILDYFTPEEKIPSMTIEQRVEALETKERKRFMASLVSSTPPGYSVVEWRTPEGDLVSVDYGIKSMRSE